MPAFDLHMHSHHSIDSAMNPCDIVKVAKRKGLNGIAVTDHNTIRGGLEVAKHVESRFYVIVGSEIKTEACEIIGLFLNEEVKQADPLEVIDAIKNQGGLTILPHPYRMNLIFHESSKTAPIEVAEKVDAIEVYNARTPASLNKKALLLATRLNKPMVAGSDAHFYPEMGNAKTILPPLNDEEELRKAILKGETAIQKGSYVFVRAIPFYCLGFFYGRARKILRGIR